MRAVRRLAGEVVRLLLPNACVVCEAVGGPERGDAEALLCRLCRARLAPVTGGCRRCGQPRPPIGPCRFCTGWDALATGQSAVWLDQGARKAVHGLKYGGLRRLAVPMASLIGRWVPHPAGRLVPIPLGRRRLAARGYNQAAELARALQRVWPLPVEHGLLVRTRETATQTTLAPEDRHENVAGAFTTQRAPRGASSTVILVDDVLTTGATLLAAASALRTAGWGPIHAVTFARAEPWGRRITG